MKARPVVPRQLPGGLRHFAGRAWEARVLDDLSGQAAGGGTVVISAIGGTAGIGKTALAVWWAHRVADRFPDGQLYVNLRGFDPSGAVMAPGEAVRGFLDAFEVPPERIPKDLDAQAALYRSLVAGRRMLIVLDNARDAQQVRALLPGSPGSLVIVTSRNQLVSLVTAEGATLLPLGLLTRDEARQLLTQRLGRRRVSAEPEALEEITTRCARLPLALAIVAARSAAHPHFPLQAIATELREARDRLDALDGGDAAADVRAVFSWSYHALTPEAGRMFRLLGLTPGPDISTRATVSLTALPLARARSLLNELARANLIVEHAPGRHTFHDLLRAYATEQVHSVDSDEERRAATGRMLDHYLHTAHTAALLLDPHRDPITLPLTAPQLGVCPEAPVGYGEAMAWFTAEHAVLLAALDHAADAGENTRAWQLAWAIGNFLNRQGHWHDWVTIGRVAVATADRLADPAAQALTHRYLAFTFMRLGRYDDAYVHLRQALALYHQIGDQVGQGQTHLALAGVQGRQGRHTEALHHAQWALDLFRAAGHRVGQAEALSAVGWCHAQLSEHTQALDCCQQALALHQELNHRVGQADTWDSLGYIHRHLGDHTRALDCYQRALDLARDVGHRYHEATTLTRLGDAHHTAGDPDAARTSWQQALHILEELDHPDADQVRGKLASLDHPEPGA